MPFNSGKPPAGDPTVTQRQHHRTDRAFTLVEILVVVVILGILAAVVAPRFTNAISDATENAAYSELQKIRRAIDVYMARNNGLPPDVTTGYGTWGGMIGTGDYLKRAPVNQYLPATNEGRIYAAADAAPDTVFQSDYGWLFNTATGELWAGGFDLNDEPLPKP